MDGYKFDNDGLPAPENKPSARGDTEQPTYKDVWNCNGIGHIRAAGYQQDAAKIDSTNEELISVLTYLI